MNDGLTGWNSVDADVQEAAHDGTEGAREQDREEFVQLSAQRPVTIPRNQTITNEQRRGTTESEENAKGNLRILSA